MRGASRHLRRGYCIRNGRLASVQPLRGDLPVFLDRQHGILSPAARPASQAVRVPTTTTAAHKASWRSRGTIRSMVQ